MKKFIPSEEVADRIMLAQDTPSEELIFMLKEQYELSDEELPSPEEERQAIIDEANDNICYSILSFARWHKDTNNIKTSIVTIRGVLIDDVWIELAQCLGIPHPFEANDIRIKLSDELLQHFSVTPYKNNVPEKIFIRDGEILASSDFVYRLPPHGLTLT